MVSNEIARILDEILSNFPDPHVNLRDLDEASYTMSKCGIWIDDVGNLSYLQILQCWKLVEFINQQGGFPKEYRMSK